MASSLRSTPTFKGSSGPTSQAGGILESKHALTGDGYVKGLDGLRGLAVLSVILGHFGVPGFKVAGGYGVDVFFVLSGYLITGILFRDAGSGRSMAHFYWNRTTRLFPALLVVSLSLFLLPDALLTEPGAAINAIGALTYTTNWTRAFPVPGWPSYMAHTWSLSVEEQFYLLWPLVLWGAAMCGVSIRNAVFSICVASLLWLAVLVVGGATQDHLYNGLDARIPGILVGAALVFVKHQSMSVKFAALALVAYFALVALVPWTVISAAGIWVISLILIDSLRANGPGLVRKALEYRPLVFVGVISYGAYLWHFPILKVMNELPVSTEIATAIGVSASLLMAYLTRIFVEIPVLRGRERITNGQRVVAGRICAVVSFLMMCGGLVFFFGGYIKVSPY